MKRVVRNRLWLLLAVTVLAAVVLGQGVRDYHAAQPALTTLDPDAVTRVELRIAQQPAQVFEKRSGRWWRVAPSALRGNDEHLQRLANLAASPVARWARPGEFDEAKVGLTPPSATLTLDGTELEYGALSALDDLRYVAVGGRIALVPRQDSPEMTLALKPVRDESGSQ